MSKRNFNSSFSIKLVIKYWESKEYLSWIWYICYNMSVLKFIISMKIYYVSLLGSDIFKYTVENTMLWCFLKAFKNLTEPHCLEKGTL